MPHQFFQTQPTDLPGFLVYRSSMIHDVAFVVRFDLALPKKHHYVPGIGWIMLFIKEQVSGAGTVQGISDTPAIFAHECLGIRKMAQPFRGGKERPAADLDLRQRWHHR